jgi:hypothetical protein
VQVRLAVLLQKPGSCFGALLPSCASGRREVHSCKFTNSAAA